MKRLSVIAALAMAVLAAGCSETQQTQVQKVREFAVRLCGFLPSVNSVAAILAASNPQVSGTLAVATAICDAVAEKPPVETPAVHRGSLVWPTILIQVQDKPKDCPQVNGVCVDGEWIDPADDKKKDKE